MTQAHTTTSAAETDRKTVPIAPAASSSLVRGPALRPFLCLALALLFHPKIHPDRVKTVHPISQYAWLMKSKM